MEDNNNNFNNGDEFTDPSVEEEVSEQEQDPSVEEEEVQEEPPLPQKNLQNFVVKIDGVEQVIELDLNDQSAIKRHLQMSRAAQKRMQEASMTKKQAEQFFHLLKNDPIKLLSDPRIGHNFRQLAEDYLSKEIESELMGEDQKKLMRAEQIMKEHEEAQRRAQEESEQKQLQQLEEHYSQHYDKLFTEALQTASVPKSPATVRRMAELMGKNLELGLELDAKQIAEMVREDYQRQVEELFGRTDGDQMLALLGDSAAKKLREADLKRHNVKPPVAKKAGTPKPKRPQGTDWMSPSDFLDAIKKQD